MSRRHAIAIAALAAISCGATVHAQHGQHAQQHGQDHGHRNDGGSTGTGHGQHQAAHDAHHQGPSCTPEHAAMGHCTLSTRAPRTPVPEPTDADRAAAFPDLHHHMEHPSEINFRVLFDRFEWQDADAGSAFAWENKTWVGSDLNRLWIHSGGERVSGTTHSAHIDLLYGRSVSAWWDVVGGLRHDFSPGPSRTWAAIGVQGLAPYWFEVSATAYLGEGGHVAASVEVEYELLLTNRLILQPVLELELHGKDDPQRGIGSGLSSAEAGLRLRYEVTRRFAPYVGVTTERLYGDTAAMHRQAGGDARDTRLVAGVRWWF